MSTSTAPTVVGALVSVASAAMTGVQVIDGQPPLNNLADDWAAICWNEDDAAISQTQALGNASLAAQRESYDVLSRIVSASGNIADGPVVRARAYQILDFFESALIADYTLGGVCMSALIVESGFIPMQTTKGPAAALMFTVHVEALKQP